MKSILPKVVFFLSLILIIIFLIWSELVFLSLFVLLVVDSITLQNASKYLIKILPSKIYYLIRLIYFFITPLFIIIIIRLLFIDVYYVPSSSMEHTLFPGNYVLINKIKYGIKIPNHLHNIPAIGKIFPLPSNNSILYKALPKLAPIKRNDIIVFKAIDNSDIFLIKRAIGLSGEEIEIIKGDVFINNIKLKELDNYTYIYKDKRFKKSSVLREYSNKEFDELSLFDKDFYEREILTSDNYTKIKIPKKGMKILLNKNTNEHYISLIKKFEDIDSIDFKMKKEHVFKNNYFFLMGDNRHKSVDSRFYGFVPENYILGKTILVF